MRRIQRRAGARPKHSNCRCFRRLLVGMGVNFRARDPPLFVILSQKYSEGHARPSCLVETGVHVVAAPK